MYKSRAYKVELSSVAELKQYANELSKADAQGTDAVIPLEKLEKEVMAAWTRFVKTKNIIRDNANDAKSVLRDFEKQAKKLGIDNASTISEYSRLEKEISEAMEVVKEMDRYNKPKIF